MIGVTINMMHEFELFLSPRHMSGVNCRFCLQSAEGRDNILECRETLAPISLIIAYRAPFSEAISENSVKIRKTVQRL